MVRRSLFLLTLFAFVLLFSACHEHHDEELRLAYGLAQSQPDSALALLNRINCQRLNEGDKARYALIYVMAQDKSGLDVDSDTLLHFATAYYASRPDDSLYAKCQYYTGKYYMLNDSTEKALNCFNQAIRAARLQHDTLTQCLALNRASVVLRTFKPALAVSYARTAYNLYNKVKDATDENKCYYLLNVAENIYNKDKNAKDIIPLIQKAVEDARLSASRTAMADALQDLSTFYIQIHAFDAALIEGKKSYKYRMTSDASATLALGQAYYFADSIQQAKHFVEEACRLGIKIKNHRTTAYSLLQHIAIKEHDFKLAASYMDSLENFLKRENIKNIKAKDSYYSTLIQREKENAISQSKNQKRIFFLIGAVIIIVLLSIFITLTFFQRKSMAEKLFQIQKQRYMEELKSKNAQISSIRNLLLNNINLTKKLEQVKSKDAKHIRINNEEWNEIEAFLESLDSRFPSRLRRDFPKLTEKDVQFLMLVRLNLSSSSIAEIFHIEEKSVKQRLFMLKDKLEIHNSKISTRDFILNYSNEDIPKK